MRSYNKLFTAKREYYYIFFLIALFVILLFIKYRMSQDHIVLLSFDVEPIDGDESVLEMLKILESNDVNATFFITGQYIERFPDVVTKISEGGFEVACHSYSHPVFTRISFEQKQK